MKKRYLFPMPSLRWAISRQINGRWIALVQDSYLDNPADAEEVLRGLDILATRENLDQYFPKRKGQGRCPTLDLIELCNALDPTNPYFTNKRECGV